jgi:predicted aspartyl protease
MRILSFVVFSLVLIGSAPWAKADESCPPLGIVASVDMGADEGSRPFVPGKIGETPKYMLVDTGAFFTGVTQAAADELKLPTRTTRMKFIGLSGATTDGVAHTSLTLGNLHADGMDFIIVPDWHGSANEGGSEVAGIIGANLLRSYDADFDFGGRKVNLLSQKHCDGKVVYWPNDGVAVVPMRLNPDGHIIVMVQLDGHSLPALLDTGATTSVLNMETAEATFGLEPGSKDTPAAGHHLNDSEIQLYSHRFKSLSLEGVTISNPELTIMPDLLRTKMPNPRDGMEHDTRIASPRYETGMGDIILGTDILRHLHFYIAYKEQKLYLSAAQAPKVAATDSRSPADGGMLNQAAIPPAAK